MFIICERPQSPPYDTRGVQLAWVIRVPVKLRCLVFAWRNILGVWRWSGAWKYDFPADQTWQQVVDSFPDMEDSFRVQYKMDYYVFADPAQLETACHSHAVGEV